MRAEHLESLRRAVLRRAHRPVHGHCTWGAEWKNGADGWVRTIKDKPWVTGLWLGDEPEILGVSYAQMCELSEYLKTALIAAGRSDVFLACACSGPPLPAPPSSFHKA